MTKVPEYRIPFVDLSAQYAQIEPEISAAFSEVLRSHSFIQGPFVTTFEREFAIAHGISHAIGCSNGTVALEVVLRGLGVGAGDEVITPANIFIATIEAICNVGAIPVFADIEASGYGIDPEAVEGAISSRTRAILPVHLYGSPCRIDQLRDLADKHCFILIEDAAQAHLAKHRGHMVGGFGDAATFSFYPGKNLGAYGDAGLIVMRDAVHADFARRYINHGRTSKYEHDILGTNYRMDGLQAAILSVKLKYLQKWTAQRRVVAAAYDQQLKSAGFKVIEPPPGAEAVYHLYVVETENRDEVTSYLAVRGVQTGIHYPIPLHRQPALSHLSCASALLPVTERAAGRILSLPIYPELKIEQVQEICNWFLEVARP